ncbi:SDR family NAD(P)-dependent oxidoreductase [Allosaccharopolyspora coralli]|uniref:SDR family NAD(P)-dependent oxidoreductase n=1 Tax=Allosaccharopolyspora coralli TaxID=2665642 RepID=A0A5Q3QCB9_9PSEU|nr:SDR family oxidoreductase [Allosaccharopolyspora coralli]QGK70884.1 SDR family NAD(P)-dependent oxidoreductase [Allosaccharopolyspora coralli]
MAEQGVPTSQGSGPPLEGTVALVAGATRGAGRGIAVELGAAGATVYVTGRSTRSRRSEYDRPENIEDTADLVTEAGGTGIPVRVDHLEREEVRALVERIDRDRGHLDVLVNDVWGGENLFAWGKPLWEQSLDDGLRLLRLGVETHLVTSHAALPLLVRKPGGLVVEVTDGTHEFNEAHYRGECSMFYDLAKVSVARLGRAQAEELRPFGGTALTVTPGWLRSEMMLDAFGVTEDTWRDAVPEVPHFCISESPRFVGRGVAAVAADPGRERWSTQSVSSGHLAQVYGFTDVDGSRPDAWRYITDVERPGHPADATGYR